jgi:hypothetical protein
MATITAEYRIPRNRVKFAAQKAQWLAILAQDQLAYYFDLFPLNFVSTTVILDPFDPKLLLRTDVMTTTPEFIARWGSTDPEIRSAFADVGLRMLFIQNMISDDILERVVIT